MDAGQRITAVHMVCCYVSDIWYYNFNSVPVSVVVYIYPSGLLDTLEDFLLEIAEEARICAFYRQFWRTSSLKFANTCEKCTAVLAANSLFVEFEEWRTTGLIVGTT